MSAADTEDDGDGKKRATPVHVLLTPSVTLGVDFIPVSLLGGVGFGGSNDCLGSVFFISVIMSITSVWTEIKA